MTSLQQLIHFPIHLKSCLAVLEIIKLKSYVERQIEYVHSVVVYEKISNSFGRNDNFLAMARKLSILSTSLDIFDIRQHYIRILYVHSMFKGYLFLLRQLGQSLLAKLAEKCFLLINIQQVKTPFSFMT